MGANEEVLDAAIIFSDYPNLPVRAMAAVSRRQHSGADIPNCKGSNRQRRIDRRHRGGCTTEP